MQKVNLPCIKVYLWSGFQMNWSRCSPFGWADKWTGYRLEKEDIFLDCAHFTLLLTKKSDCQLQRRNLLPCFSQIVARSICSPVKIQGEKHKEAYDLIAKGKCFEMRLYTAETKNTKKENIQESGDLNIKWEYFKIGFRWEKIGNLCKFIFRLGTCRGRTRSRRAEQSRMRRCPLTKPVLLSSS